MNSAPINGYESWFTIRSHEIDASKHLTIPSLLMLMQEASMHNARQLQISIWDAGMGDLSWVILKKDVQVIKMPSLDQRVKVITYPAGFKRIFAFRDFLVLDEDLNVLATASSTWTLMNLSERKISKIPDYILKFEIPSEDQLLPKPQLKLQLPTLEESYKYTIKHYDLDWNNHVNNIVLTKLMLQSSKHELLRSSQIHSLTIHIKSECFLGEEITTFTKNINDCSYYKITGHQEKIIATASACWK